MIVDSNAPAPLKYTDPTFTPSLFVRMLIIDTSGGSPVLEASVNLAQYTTSGVYFGKYTFTAGKTYLLIGNAYTDGTYATVDTGYAQDTENVQCRNLAATSAASQASVDAIAATLGTPAGASVSADIAAISVGSGGGVVYESLSVVVDDSDFIETQIEGNV